MPLALLAIAAGAALGAWARWGLSLWLNPAHHAVPMGTLAANLVGGYLIGLAVAGFAQAPQLAPEWRLFVITGMLGGLTTFSTFSAETVDLLQKQAYGWAFGTIAAHLLGSLAMTGLGLWTVKMVAR
ncbi:fluoride efflux transporter CrcB [Lysobacter auxotrophicus]|uniref:Fluoride-specific ion channel FluC n=1 Tax=Lysobacter auxotrophicus TaxID=2992573 RepID=A0ABN6UEQ6_9GAMM|nr:fluoride efflux transporter CrcB [Lysobacter auxotrophicus]BDU14829.1 fluoride efflux transporter CrcB [Lysobacter auxotrophicus]